MSAVINDPDNHDAARQEGAPLMTASAVHTIRRKPVPHPVANPREAAPLASATARISRKPAPQLSHRYMRLEQEFQRTSPEPDVALNVLPREGPSEEAPSVTHPPEPEGLYPNAEEQNTAPRLLQRTEDLAASPEAGASRQQLIHEKSVRQPHAARWWWRPWSLLSWTHPVALCLFCLLFILIIIALVVLAYLSRSRNGFVVPANIGPYAWKFGPTAFFTIVIALWRQVDRELRLEAPWREMKQSLRPAKVTVLLDYTSPLLPVALYESIRNKHWRVVLGMAVFALLKLTVAFSTGLLLVEDTSLTTMDSSVSLRLMSGAPRSDQFTGGGSSYQDYYLNEVYGTLVVGTPFEPGISDSAAFQEMSADNNFPANATVTATVQAFFPDLDCQDATLSGSCDFIGVHSGNCSGNVAAKGPACWDTSWCTATQCYFVSSSAVLCATSDDPYTTVVDTWMFAVLAYLPSSPSNSSSGTVLSWSSALACKMRYSIDEANLTVNMDSSDSINSKHLNRPVVLSNNTLPEYSFSDLTFNVWTYFDTEANPITPIVTDSSSIHYYFVSQLMQYVIAGAPGMNVESLRDTKTFQQSVKNVMNRLAAQAVGPWLSFPDHLRTTGSYTYDVKRLKVQNIAFWEMFGGLTLILLLTVVILIRSSAVVLARTMKLMSSRATIVPPDNATEGLLDAIGSATDSDLVSHLATSSFCVKYSGVGRVELHSDAQQDRSHQDRQNAPLPRAATKPWIPMSAKTWFVVLCVCLSVNEIAMLEVLQRLSDDRGGICDVRIPLNTAKILVALLSATVMLSTAAIFSANEWATGVFAPFKLLRKGTTLDKVDHAHSDSLAPLALWYAVRSRQFGVCLMISATLLGSFLTIIVSGLFSIEMVPRTYTVAASTLSQYNPSWNLTEADSTANLFRLIRSHNATYPVGTYAEVAYPEFTLNENDTHWKQTMKSANGSVVHADLLIPSIRAMLECSFAPENSISYFLSPPSAAQGAPGIAVAFPGYANVAATFDVPEGLQSYDSPWQNVSKLRAYASIANTDNAEEFTSARIMQIIPDDDSFDEPFFDSNMSWNYPTSVGYPSIGFAIGRFANDTSPKNKTVMMCTQRQKEVAVTLHIDLPDLNLDTANPPRYLDSPAKTIASYQYDFQTLLALGLEGANSQYFGAESENFVQALQNWTGLSLNDMMGPENQTAFSDAVQRVYGTFMAQMFNGPMKLVAADLNTTNNIPGVLPIGSEVQATLYDQSRHRLFQNNIPKITLQVILAAMVLCLIAAYFLSDFKSVDLPHNPCSIAGSLCLLVGGSFARDVAGIMDEVRSGDVDEPGRRLAGRHLRLGWRGSGYGGDEGGHADVHSKTFGIDYSELVEHGM